MAELSARPFPSIIRNLVVLVAYWLVALVLVQAGHRLSDGWILPKAGELIAAVLALLIASRLAARVGTYFAAVAIAYSAAGFLIHSIFGIGAAQGAPVHLAVITAAVLGVLLGSTFALPFKRTVADLDSGRVRA